MSTHSEHKRQNRRAKCEYIVGKNAERERNRVRCLRAAFQSLQGRLPTVPPNTKLSKLDILILATNYIGQLTKVLSEGETTNHQLQNKFFHPIKKWPMRTRLYSPIEEENEHLQQNSHSLPEIQQPEILPEVEEFTIQPSEYFVDFNNNNEEQMVSYDYIEPDSSPVSHNSSNSFADCIFSWQSLYPVNVDHDDYM